jgi:DNA-binding NarL/FixJ family response regulator
MTKIRALLVDDHTLVRRGVRRVLEADGEITVVGECCSGRAAIDMVEEVQPHVVVMDIALPELNGFEATRQITKRSERTRVLMLSMHGDRVYVRQSLKAGARGYVLKNAEALELIEAVKAVGRGGSFFSPEISRLMLEKYVGDEPDDSGETDLARLTPREREVMQLIAEGLSSKEVAARLDLGVSTVDTHRKRIMEKLALRNTADLVRFAIRSKVVH